MSALIGLFWTGVSWIRSSRIAQYALIAAAVAVAVFLYGRSKKKQGAAEALARAAEAALQRMEKNREIHREIQRLPLGERADRLRALDSRR